jgi:translation initiation factor eIF-2B subunit epsilon
VAVDATFFAERDTLAVRTDLQDAEIYMCAPEVLLLYADNWDFQHMRRDFITGVLSEEELGNKLYVYVLENEYAQRVHNFRTYDAVTRDVLLRWVHPLVPDSNLLPDLLVRLHPVLCLPAYLHYSLYYWMSHPENCVNYEVSTGKHL